MAEGGKLVLSNVLCFVGNKIGKIPIKTLKSILCDFYDAEVLCEAKVRLLDDSKSLGTLVKLPHIPRRREGDNRVVREIDDIVTIFTRLDEHKVFDQLPRYCASGPDEMPSSRICEGDLNVFLTMLEKLHGRINEFGSVMAAISRDVGVLQTRLPPEPFPPLPRADFAQPSRQPSAGNSAAALQGNSGLTSIDQDSTVLKTTVDWASIASTSTPTANRYSVLALETEEDQMHPFVDVQPRKRQRNKTSPPQYSHQQSQQPQQQSQQQRSLTSRDNARPQQQQQHQSRRRPPVLGKSTTLNSIAAANKVKRRKAVYCIDNVDVACTADDIKRFVSAQSIEVVSCFETKPRRRRYDAPGDPIVDRRAFRLCIYHDDCKRLLDASIWPDSLLIYEWFFKSQQSAVVDRSTRQCLDVNAISRHDTAVVAQVNMDSTNLVAEPANADSEVNVNMDLNDETITVVNIDANAISNNGDDGSSC